MGQVNAVHEEDRWELSWEGDTYRGGSPLSIANRKRRQAQPQTSQLGQVRQKEIASQLGLVHGSESHLLLFAAWHTHLYLLGLSGDLEPTVPSLVKLVGLLELPQPGVGDRIKASWLGQPSSGGLPPGVTERVVGKAPQVSRSSTAPVSRDTPEQGTCQVTGGYREQGGLSHRTWFNQTPPPTWFTG